MPSRGTRWRVLRGGCWWDDADAVRCGVGQELTAIISLTEHEEPRTVVVEVPESSLELTAFVHAPGFFAHGESRITIPILLNQASRRRASLMLVPIASGEHTVTVDVYPGGGVSDVDPVRLTQTIQVRAPIALPNIRELIDQRKIPSPQADLILYVTLEETELPGKRRVRYYLTCPELRLDRQPIERAIVVGDGDLTAIRQAAVQSVSSLTQVARAASSKGLRALGEAFLYHLVPSELTELLQKLPRRKPRTLLVISDERAVLPWELVCVNEALSSAFILSQWILGQGLSPSPEVPLGQVCLTHYHQHLLHTRRWERTLGTDRQVAVDDRSGFRALMEPGSPYYGLHVLRYSDPAHRGQITELRSDERRERLTSQNAISIVYQRQLDFSLRRPLVTLSFLSENSSQISANDTGTSTDLEFGWVLPFLHAGATAVVGPRWTVAPEVDELFYRVFYGVVREGGELPWAAWRARMEIRRAFPHRTDWLSYAYFGHPHCSPYAVRAADAFALFEAVETPKGDVFEPGRTYQFRASYRRTPPAWYDGPIRISEPLANLADIAVTVMPMQGESPVTRCLTQLMPDGDYQCLLELTMPKTETAWPVFVRFHTGAEELHSLILELDVVKLG
jgi:hypothetical protein